MPSFPSASWVLPCLLAVAIGLPGCREPRAAAPPPPVPGTTAFDPNGIGKLYMGRQIAQVMGHEGAEWLERPGREREEATAELVRLLRLRDTDVVADIGAGTGYLTFRLAPLVPHGRVKAVDIQPEMLDILKKQKRELAADNVDVVLGTEQSPGLPPGSITLAVLVDAYHEFAYPREMMTAVVAALRPGGRVALVEFKAEDPSVPIKAVHKMSIEQCRREMAAVGLRFREARPGLPWQHLLVFEKSAD